MVLFLIDTINLGTFGGGTSSVVGAEFTMLNDVSEGSLGVVNAVIEVLQGIFNFRRTLLSSSSSAVRQFSVILLQLLESWLSRFISKDGPFDIFLDNFWRSSEDVDAFDKTIF